MAQAFDARVPPLSLSSLPPPPASHQPQLPLEIGVEELTAADRRKRREEKKLMLFIMLFSINLCVIIALLLLWNVKGISNNITWALLAVCGMAGFSVFCCVLYVLVCVNERNVVASAICCCPRRPSNQIRASSRFFKNMPFSLKKWKNGFGKKQNCYSVQTVFPTPEFHYFSNSPPATLSIGTRERPKLDRTMSSSKDSQLSGVAFSAISTAPASSMLDIAEMCVELEHQASQEYFSTLQSVSLPSSRRDDRAYRHQSPMDNSSTSSMSPREYEAIPDEPANPRSVSAEMVGERRQSATVDPNPHLTAAGRYNSSSFVNMAMDETSFDDFEYVSIPWERPHRLAEKQPRIKYNSHFSSPILINVYSGL